MKPRQLTILGVGLLGGSIGLAVRSAFSGCRIIGYGHREKTLAAAREMGAIDDYSLDAAAAVRGSDWVILCTPVGIFEQNLREISAALSAGCTVTDVGSTKRSVAELAEKILPGSVDFVPSHPMAGSEKRGVEFARADLFRGALCILTPTPATPAAAVERVEGFWKMLGMRTARLLPDQHDRLLADVSHLPHVLAAAMIAMQEDSALELAGPGFLDSTRIAGGDGALWRDILLDNSANLRESLAKMKAQIGAVESMLASGNGEEIRRWLDAAAERRRELLQRKGRGE